MTTRCEPSSTEMKRLSSINICSVQENHVSFLDEGSYALALETHLYALSVFPFYGENIEEDRTVRVPEYWPKVAKREDLWDGQFSLKKERVLVHTEARGEDVVAAARFLYLLRDEKPKQVLFLPPENSYKFFEAIFENDPLIKVVKAVEKNDFDVHMPLFLIPSLLDLDFNDLSELPFLDRGEPEQFHCSILGTDRYKIGLIGSDFPPTWMDRVDATFFQLSAGKDARISVHVTDLTGHLNQSGKEMLNAMEECDELYVDDSFWGCAAGAMGFKAKICRSGEFPSRLSPGFEQNALLYPTVEQIDPSEERTDCQEAYKRVYTQEERCT